MSSLMSLMMTSKKKARLYTEEEIGYERVFEIKILDFRQRHGIKQKSFSLSVVEGTKDSDYDTTEELRDFLKKSLRKKNYV